jgi:hypothetical protein
VTDHLRDEARAAAAPALWKGSARARSCSRPAPIERGIAVCGQRIFPARCSAAPHARYVERLRGRCRHDAPMVFTNNDTTAAAVERPARRRVTIAAVGGRA